MKCQITATAYRSLRYPTFLKVPFEQPAIRDVSVASRGPLARYLMAALGLLFIVIGFIGVFVPGLPTTGPLMLASLFLAKSNPVLERRLLGLPIFAKYVGYIDGSALFTLRARLTALAWMWCSITVSCLLLGYSARATSVMLGIIVVLGLIGTIVILRIRRGPQKRVQSELDLTP